jgi:flagellar basal body P-ring protein FlgI
VTPLLGADGNVYAVAQGSLAIGGFQAEGEASKIVANHGAGSQARAAARPQPDALRSKAAA